LSSLEFVVGWSLGFFRKLRMNSVNTKQCKHTKSTKTSVFTQLLIFPLMVVFTIALSGIATSDLAHASDPPETAQQLRLKCSQSFSEMVGCKLALAKIWAGALIGSAEHQHDLGNLYYKGWYEEPTRIVQAEKWFLRAAINDDARAQFNLYKLYRNGAKWIPKNKQQSQYWLLNSAFNDFEPAVLEHIILFKQKKLLVQRLPLRSLELIEQKAEVGNKYAQYLLAITLNRGKGFKRDDEQAFHWMLKSAQQQFFYSELNVGLLYSQGIGVEKNNEQALYWIKKAVEHKLPKAQYILALMYVNGDIVKKDISAALPLIQAAIGKGDPQAELLLASLHNSGEGVAKNVKLAEQLTRSARAKMGPRKFDNFLVDLHLAGA